MTSDRIPTPAEQRLVEFADLIFRGKHASRTGIDPEQAELIVRLKQGDRVPSFDATVIQPRKEQLMSLVTTAPAGAMPGPGTVAAPPNGRLPYPIPSYPRARAWRPTLMQLVSAAVLLALIGGLIFGIVENRNDVNPTMPAVVPASPSPEASPLGGDWGQFRGGVERTGYTTDPGPGADLTLRWTFTSEESLNGIMEAGGNVIGFGAGGGLYAIDALTGAQVWAVDLSAGSAGDPGTAKLPAIDNGTIFVSTLEGDLIAVDAADGTVLWQQHLAKDTPNSPAVANGTVYVVADGNRFLGFDAETGEQTWEAAIPGVVDNQFPTIADGKIFITDDTSKVHAFDLASGKLLWSSADIAAHRVSAFMDGVLYVPGFDGRLTAISSKDGHVLWATEPSNGEALNPIATPSVIVDVVAGTGAQGLDPKTGAVLWNSDLVVSGTHSPHAAGDYVYLHRDDDNYVALRLSDGSIAATTDQAAGAGSTAAISGSLLFVSGVDGDVRAFGPGTDQTLAAFATPAAEPAVAGSTSSSTNQDTTIEAPASDSIGAILVATMPADGPQTLILADDSDGHIWMNDMRDGSLQEYDRDLNLLKTWPFGLGSGPGEFNWAGIDFKDYPDFGWTAAAMAWGPDGTIYVTDDNNARIQLVSPAGKLIGSWDAHGTGDGQFLNPVGIARQADEIAVVDIGRRDIQWFDLQGNFLRKLEGPQPGTQFLRPSDIVYDSEGNFWVMDAYGNQLFKFDKDGSLLLTVGSRADTDIHEPGHFAAPSDFAIDPQDRIWVADQWNQRIQVFDASGNLVAVWDGCDTDATCFQETALVFADSNGDVFVADYDGEGMNPPRLMKFKITSMPEVPMMAAATPAPQGSPAAG